MSRLIVIAAFTFSSPGTCALQLGDLGAQRTQFLQDLCEIVGAGRWRIGSCRLVCVVVVRGPLHRQALDELGEWRARLWNAASA